MRNKRKASENCVPLQAQPNLIEMFDAWRSFEEKSVGWCLLCNSPILSVDDLLPESNRHRCDETKTAHPLTHSSLSEGAASLPSEDDADFEAHLGESIREDEAGEVIPFDQAVHNAFTVLDLMISARISPPQQAIVQYYISPMAEQDLLRLMQHPKIYIVPGACSPEAMDNHLLQPSEFEWVEIELAAYIREQSHQYYARAKALAAVQRNALTGYFHKADLDRVRVLGAANPVIAEPAFYQRLKALGMCGLPEFSLMQAVTFDDVIVACGPIDKALLFHEMVHATQYRILGVERFASLYVRYIAAEESLDHTSWPLRARTAKALRGESTSQSRGEQTLSHLTAQDRARHAASRYGPGLRRDKERKC